MPRIERGAAVEEARRLPVSYATPNHLQFFLECVASWFIHQKRVSKPSLFSVKYSWAAEKPNEASSVVDQKFGACAVKYD